MSNQKRAEARGTFYARGQPKKQSDAKRERPILPYPYTHKLACGTWYGYRDATHHYLKPLEKSPTRIVEGWASTGRVSTNNQAVNTKTCIVSLPTPLCVSHGRLQDGKKVTAKQGAVGEIFEATCSDEGVYIKAAIWNTKAGDHAWRLVQDGTLKELSIAARDGSSTLNGVVRGVRYYDKWALSEVSLCPKGACPGAVVTRFYAA